MPTYRAPLDDIRFVLHEVLGVERLAAYPGYEEATPDLVDAILEEAGRVAETVLFPLNQPGDREGCHFENGVVRTPQGFPEAYRTYREGGWTGLACAPEYGGQGLPKTLAFVIEELMTSANMAFAMYPGLTLGAHNALVTYGSDELKATYLPKLVDGSWAGTMCLTEPQCGTDLGLIRTKAEPNGDGSYALTGTKIFISGGEQDLTENIVHLVLARLPDAPKGIRGISLFVVPKFLPVEEDGALVPGPRNGVACGSIEHKMGIRASATCVMNFEEAQGWLVGEPHRGMRAMFVMMNAARLGVGMQGLALAEVAYQNARDYARERRQGRALTGPAEPEAPADPLIVHPDVRNMLMTAKAFVEGARALAYWIGMELDVAAKDPDPERRGEADDLLALMTPVIKAYFTDAGFDTTNLAVQVFGGHGYIAETGVEQYVRDARIPRIFEGTNGIQAMDLVGRKLPLGTGRLLRRFFHPVEAYLDRIDGESRMAGFARPLREAFGILQKITALVAQRGLAKPEEAGAAASDYLRLFALVALGYMWARMAETALDRMDGNEERRAFYDAKLKTAEFYFARVLPEAYGLAAKVKAGGRTTMALPAEVF